MATRFTKIPLSDTSGIDDTLDTLAPSDTLAPTDTIAPMDTIIPRDSLTNITKPPGVM